LTKHRVYVVKTRVKMPIEKNTEQKQRLFWQGQKGATASK
jgi:hypothetical protein